MSQENSHIKHYSLSQLMDSISSVISRTYTKAYWIKAEMIKLNRYTKSNHCYPDLVEKEEGKIRAQIRATLWSNTFFRINAKFVKETGKALGDGMSILFLAEVRHDALHGLSLNILDIDAQYELGQLAKSKEACIKRLKTEGLFDRNKSLKFPILPQRIAVVSVETSKGYSDFVNIIQHNSRGYKFFHMLFPALLQGDSAVDSILEQLHRIASVKQHFDVVAIIRGGGGEVGLSCYDHYELASAVASFPLPIISGIGHSTNETVVEMVANYNPITPTDVAYFLQQCFDNNAMVIQKMTERIALVSRLVVNNGEVKLNGISQYVKMKVSGLLQQEKHALQKVQQSMIYWSGHKLRADQVQVSHRAKEIQLLASRLIGTEKHKLTHIESTRLPLVQKIMHQERKRIGYLFEKINLLKPENLLKKGYSLTLMDGKPLTDLSKLDQGDELLIKTYQGEIETTVTKIKQYGKGES